LRSTSTPVSLAALTVARSDFGRMERFYHALLAEPDFRIALALGAAHWDQRLGATAVEVERSGLPIGLRLPQVTGSFAEQAAGVLVGLGAWLEATRPDALILLGDRFEMLAAGQAATLARVPIVHVGGGHLTLGAIDDRVRHALTKLSAVHMVASAACAQRVAALAEEDTRIFVTGAPELEALRSAPDMSRASFCAQVGLDAARPFLLCTFHPETTLDREQNAALATQAEFVLRRADQQILLTAPCADPGHEPFLRMCEALPSQRRDCRYIPNLGFVLYAAALRHAVAMVGNSSSGIIEAASAGLPVVNVGRRQEQRDRAANVIDCAFTSEAMDDAIARALQPAFAAQSRAVTNPYGDGSFSVKAVAALKSLRWPLDAAKPWTPGGGH
jgi:UDP-N-acetylglucosamine 2-epimerase (non-hydrolysing)